jgi:hypothetical protein
MRLVFMAFPQVGQATKAMAPDARSAVAGVLTNYSPSSDVFWNVQPDGAA